ncbi:uncharacterized protein CTRU02_202658 [Colletotrichum truncatum]|uniref:Uncharacterized protein n=1 Tax=Colletotrichum truncatum TaxID=5467 RepID=A0ACC3ZKV3_COLTU|nr:uncharacterized protein CTRU02_10581 [Colletotrichum truncatum]KAF6786882.1 hypothetical protein CTRU02_10581 [Colletotrichum truncatum]
MQVTIATIAATLAFIGTVSAGQPKMFFDINCYGKCIESCMMTPEDAKNGYPCEEICSRKIECFDEKEHDRDIYSFHQNRQTWQARIKAMGLSKNKNAPLKNVKAHSSDDKKTEAAQTTPDLSKNIISEVTIVPSPTKEASVSVTEKAAEKVHTMATKSSATRYDNNTQA